MRQISFLRLSPSSWIAICLACLFVLPAFGHSLHPASVPPAPAAHAAAPAGDHGPLRFQVDNFTVKGAGPYTLSHTPTDTLELVFLDGRLIPISNFVMAGRQIKIGRLLDLSAYSRLTVCYTY